jgi:hypothetical protein
MPDLYVQPMGLPVYWRDEVSGELASAVEAYFDAVVKSDDSLITASQIELVRSYCEYHINAPCWLRHDDTFKAEITALRSQIKTANTVEMLRAYINKGMEIALDPL